MSTIKTNIQVLEKDNYETWRMQMEAVLIKNVLWEYVSGTKVKPENTAQAPNADADWIMNDQKAKADFILCVSPSQLTQLRGCTSSRQVWLKLENIFASKGLARKATLLKQLTLHRMSEGDDVRSHINKFFDIKDKLNDMNVEINSDLFSIMLLYSLPNTFENFRCAIESRDDLPDAESLKVKILEEYDARVQKSESVSALAVSMQKKVNSTNSNNKRGDVHTNSTQNKIDNRNSFHKSSYNKFSTVKCYRCQKRGHIASRCRSQLPIQNIHNNQSVNMIDDDAYIACVEDLNNCSNFVKNDRKWILDSGCTAHLCKDNDTFEDMPSLNENLNLPQWK